MDPNETLRKIREFARLFVDSGPDLPAGTSGLDVADLAQHIEALDGWLSKGGFLPKDWAFKTSPGGGCPHHDDEEECS